jgi:class 3 adenylate cyclase
MKRFSFKSTQVRMAWFIGALVLAAALNAVIGIINAAAYQQQLAELHGYTAMLEKHSNARISLLKQQLAVKNTFISEEDRVQDYGNLERYSDQFEDYLYTQQLQHGNDGQVAQLVQSSETLYDQLETFFDLLFTEETSYEDLAPLILEQIDPNAIAIDNQLAALFDQETQSMAGLLNSMEEKARMNMITGQAALVLLAVMIVWGIYTILNISSPLERLNSAVVAFENHSYSPELLEREVQRPDELGRLARSVGGMAESITAANQLTQQFLQAAQRFIPSQYLEFLGKESITSVKLGDHVSAEMAVMFSDIRGFTSMSEKMTAKENFDFVNEYLKLISPIIQKHEGFIVKFLGDGMMAIFPYGVDDAVKAGIEKEEVVQKFNQTLAARGYSNITVGIGVHTGPMMVGMIGEELRMQGDAFSDNVNLTSRIEGLNKFYGTWMIISEDTLNQLSKPIAFKIRYLGKAVVKGRINPLGMYEIYEGLPEEERMLKDSIREDFERGVALYEEGCFADAGLLFEKVLQKAPTDKTARYYLESCAEWIDRPRPEHWDGAIVMDSK